MARVSAYRTKTDAALAAIRERILAGDLGPGDRLRAEALADELDMSATPVREALRILQADRMVDYKPHHGIVVAGLSGEEIKEIYALRAVLESLAVKQATPVLLERPELMARLEAIHADLVEKAKLPSRNADVSALNADWHWVIYTACEMPYLRDFIGTLWERVPWRTKGARPAVQVETAVREHGQIMEAIRAGDADRAAALMGRHVLGGREKVVVSAEQAKPSQKKT